MNTLFRCVLSIFLLCISYVMGIAGSLSKQSTVNQTPANTVLIDGLYFDLIQPDHDGYILSAVVPYTEKNGIIEDYIIPSEVCGLPVLAIGSGAFENLKTVKTVMIPDGVRTIGPYAFSGCTGLESLIIPDSVTEIHNICSGCTSLREIRLPSGIEVLSSLVDGLRLSGTGIILFSVPEGVKSFTNDIFKDSEVKEVILPDSIEQIDGDCFRPGENRIGAFYYRGNEESFREIHILTGGSFSEMEPDEIQILITEKVWFYSAEEPSENPERYWHEADGKPVTWK